VRWKRYQFAGEQRYGTIPRTTHAAVATTPPGQTTRRISLTRLRRVADEIERELRQGRNETALDVRKAAGIRDGEIYAGGALPWARKGDIQMGGIDARRPSAPSPLGQDEGDAPGSASHIEHTAFLRWLRKIHKRTSEQSRPPAEKPLIGCPVVGAIR
jgi:hypothetical protein